MATYIVQARGSDAAALERARFVPDQFSWAAFILAQLWLLYHRLWLTLLIWIVVEAAFFVFAYPHMPVVATVAVDLLARLYLGFEASRLLAGKGSRHVVLTDLVEGADRDEAEATFFKRHAAAIGERPEAAA